MNNKQFNEFIEQEIKNTKIQNDCNIYDLENIINKHTKRCNDLLVYIKTLNKN